MTTALERKDYLSEVEPRWCPGCGDYGVLKSFTAALAQIGIPRENVVVISGIGCSSRFPHYTQTYGFHGIHGRAPVIALGVKITRPELSVWVVTGDGDALSIGGNHFIHAARRNLDMTVILINNFIYGMTGGQVAPTTPLTATASTTPYGNFEQPFNLPYLAESSGAVYVARWTAYHVRHVTKSIKEALAKKGFSFVEILAPCPTLYSRRNKLGDGLEQMIYYRENSEIRHGADTKSISLEFQGKIIVGKFVDTDRPTYLDAMNDYYARKFGEKYVQYKG